MPRKVDELTLRAATLIVMTMTVGGTAGATFAEVVAAEVRAMIGRRGMNQTQLAESLGVTQMYVSRRIKPRNPIPMDVEDLARFAQVLDCSIFDLLPRLDSNQQPSGDPYPLVSGSLVAA